jgi:hypothetical protein
VPDCRHPRITYDHTGVLCTSYTTYMRIIGRIYLFAAAHSADTENMLGKAPKLKYYRVLRNLSFAPVFLVDWAL